MTLGGGGGSYDAKKNLLFASVAFLYNGTCRALASCSGRPAVQYVYSDYTFWRSLTKLYDVMGGGGGGNMLTSQ